MKIKKYIKNYRNNNLPETLFLIGVFVLSIGLFIEPKSTWFLGIYFYKSDLQTITTISKILGTVIISSSIILNLKKYTNKGGTQYVNNVKDTKIEKEDVEEKKPVINIIETETYLKKTGGFIVAVGCLTLVVNAGIYLYYFFNKETVLSSVFLLMFAVSIVFIILGKRIKNLNDINTKLYLNLVTILSLLFGVVVIYSGGRIGILFFFLIGYLVISLRKIHIAMKVKDFNSKLSTQKYKFNKNSWITFIVIFLGLLTFFIIKDINYLNTPNIDWEKEYSTESTFNETKPSYTLQELQRMGAEPVYNNLKEEASGKYSWQKENDSKNTVLTNTPNWTAYNFEDNKFSILFPVNPKVDIWKDTNENINIPLRMNTYLSISESLNLAFHVETITNKSGDFIPEDTDSFLSETFNLISSFGVDKNYDLISSNYGYLNDKRVFNFLTKEKNGTFSKKGIILFNKDTSYIITMLYDNGDNNEEIYNKFINSFKILK